MTRTQGWLRLGSIAVVGLGCLLIVRTTARGFQLTAATEDVDNAGQSLTVEHEVVALTFVGASAGWNDKVGWEGPVASAVLDCHEVVPGFTMLVGSYDGREELQLSLTTPDGVVWTTGPGDRNSDGVPHARLRAISPDTVRVEWEDLPTDGDADFNDCVVDLRISPITR